MKLNVKPKILCGLISVFIGMCIYTIVDNFRVCEIDYKIKLRLLPDNKVNYKIAHISDFHDSHQGNKVISIVNKVKPDIIVITCDLVDCKRLDISLSINLVSDLVKIAPCYYVFGNHEAHIGDYYLELKSKLEDIGCNILDNKSEIVDGFNIVGYSDPDFGISEHNGLIKDNYINILLSHRPELIDRYSGDGADLVFTGHAHGGQFRLPFIGGLFAPNQGGTS